MKDIKQQMVNFRDIYYNELSEEQKALYDLMENYFYNS